MIRHLFTLIWNRRRANFLLITEVFLAFVVLFVVGSMLVYNQQNYRAPLGFAYQDVWRGYLDPGIQPKTTYLPITQQIMQRLRTMPGVVAVGCMSSNTPFSGSTNSSTVHAGTDKKGASLDASGHYMDDDMQQVLQFPLVAGRWFDKRDDATAVPPAVLTEDLAQTLFPQQSALGQTLNRNEQRYRVVGLIKSFRADGDLEEPRPAILMRVNPQDTTLAEGNTLMLRVQPRAGAALERQVNTQMQATAKGWNVGTSALTAQRARQLKEALTPIVALVLVCVFLIVNVALGLFGVLWQTISRRRGEIGLRRAFGASPGAISGQIVGEILVVTTFGLVLGLLVAVQFPLLGVRELGFSVYGPAMLLATGLIYLLTTLCALYPSQLAAGIQPAVALREE